MPLGLQIVLYALLAIAVLLIVAVNLVLFVRVRIKIGFREKLYCKLYIGGVRVLTLPRPPKKLRNLRTYTKEKAARAAAKQAKHIEDHLESLRSHPIYKMIMQRYAQSKKKKAPQKPAPDAKPKAKKKESDLDVEVLMTLLAELLEALLDGTHKGVHVHVCKLHVWVVGQDAAQTALLTGALWAALSNLLAVLNRLTRLRIRHADVSLIPDYTGDTTRTDFCLTMSCNLYRALRIFLPLIPIFLSHKDSLIKSSQKQAAPTT